MKRNVQRFNGSFIHIASDISPAQDTTSMSGSYSIPSYATPGPIPPDQYMDGNQGTEERGVKRKIAGWTAPPLDSFVPSSFPLTMTTSDSGGRTGDVGSSNGFIAKQEPAPASEPFGNPLPSNEPITEPIKMNLSRTASPVPAPVVEEPIQSQPARMGTRLPGSGDLANTGPRTISWPKVSGVHVGEVISDGNGNGNDDGNVNGDAETQEGEDGREEVIEEECYSWGDLPMNKQGEFCGCLCLRCVALFLGCLGYEGDGADEGERMGQMEQMEQMERLSRAAEGEDAANRFPHQRKS
jgi:hypothetical protein